MEVKRIRDCEKHGPQVARDGIEGDCPACLAQALAAALRDLRDLRDGEYVVGNQPLGTMVKRARGEQTILVVRLNRMGEHDVALLAQHAVVALDAVFEKLAELGVEDALLSEPA